MSDALGDTQINDAYTIGAILRGAREASGESIEDVSRILRINWRYLEALEEGRFGELPGSAYAIGFIRTYADHLGIDSANLIDQFKALGDTGRSKTALEFPEPIPESGLPGGAILFAGLIVAVLAYGGWYLATEEDSFLARMVSPVPEHLVDATEEASTEQVTETEAVPQPTVVEEGEGVSEVVSVETTEPPVEEVTAEAEEVVGETAGTVVEAIEAEEAVIEETVDAAVREETDDVEEASTDITEAVEEQVESQVTEQVPEPTVENITDQAAEQPTEESIAATESVEETVERADEVVAIETSEESSESVVEEAVSEQIEEAAGTADAAEMTAEDAEGATVDVSQTPDTEGQAVSENAAAEDDAARALNEEQLRTLQESMIEGASEVIEDASAESDSEAVSAATEAVETVESISAADTDTISADDTNIGVTADDQVSSAPAEDVAAETSTGRVFGEEGSARIVVRARTNSWIQVKDNSTGQLLLTRMLRVGDEYHVPNRDGLSLLTGNAGALEILVDGETVPSIGASGDVRRDVALDADQLKSGSTPGQ